MLAQIIFGIVVGLLLMGISWAFYAALKPKVVPQTVLVNVPAGEKNDGEKDPENGEEKTPAEAPKESAPEPVENKVIDDSNLFLQNAKLRLKTSVGPKDNYINVYAATCEDCNAKFGAYVGVQETKTDNGVFKVHRIAGAADTIALEAADGTFLGQSTKDASLGSHATKVIHHGHYTDSSDTKTHLVVMKGADDKYVFYFPDSQPTHYLGTCNGCVGKTTAVNMNEWNNVQAKLTKQEWTVLSA